MDATKEGKYFSKEHPEDLMPQEILERVPELYGQEEIALADKEVFAAYVLLFRSDWTWYLTEYDPKTHNAFGLVVGEYPEWGYFNLDELKQLGAQRLILEDFPKTFRELKDTELVNQLSKDELERVFSGTLTYSESPSKQDHKKGVIGYEVYRNYKGGSESMYFLDKKEALAQLDIPKQEFLNEVNQRGVRYMKDEFYEVTITEFSGKGTSIPTSNQELAMMIKDDIEEKLTANVIDASHYDYESYIEEYETYHEFDFDKPSEKAYDKRDDEAINTILKEKCDKASTLLKDSSIDWFITEAAIVNLNSECFSQGIYYDTNEKAFLVNKDNYCFPTFDDVSSIVDGLEPVNIACFALKGKKIQQEIKHSNL